MSPIPTLIHRLSPLGPIFSKELRVTARRKRTYLLRFIYLGLLLLVLLAVFAPQQMPESAVARANRLAELGYSFFAAFAWFTLMAMVLAGPVLTSTAISAERLHNTLGVLLMTPISAWQLVAGKLFSRVLIALTLIGLSLPVLAVVRLMGGVEISQMLAVLALCVATLLFTASVGLLFSILLRRAYAVILLSYALFFLIWGIIPTLVIWGIALLSFARSATGPNFGPLQTAVRVISQFNPLAAMTQAVFGQSAGGILALAPWQWSAIWQLVLALVTLILCARLVRRVAAREGETPAPQRAQLLPPPQFDQYLNAPEAAAARALPATAPMSKRHRRKDVFDNPVLWRELGRPLLARPWQRWLAIIILTLVLGFSYILIAVGEQLDEPYVQVPFAWIFCMVMSALTCVLSATAIAQEKESDTWTLLLATAVSPDRIVAGKVMGLLRRLLWPSALIVAHLVLFTLTGAIPPVGLLVVLAMIFATNALWIATGIYFSIRLRTVTFAVVLNLLMPLAAYLGAWLVFAILGVPWLVTYYSPYPHFRDAIVDLRYRDMDSLQALIVTSLVIAHLMVALLILGYTSWRFDTIVGRAAQTEPLQQATVHAAPSAAVA